jgi:hypothetical protein
VRYVTPVCAQRHLTKPVSRDIPLQFHLSPETDFQKAFYGFLEKRTQLIKQMSMKTDTLI